MSAQASIKIQYDMYRKGGGITASNRYHVTGGDWQDATHFDTFADALVAAFRAVLPAAATMKDAIGYNSGSDLPAFTKTYTGAGGVASGAAKTLTPSDCAALLRFSTTQRSTKNHPIYLFKYIRPCYVDINGAIEVVAPTWQTLLNTYCNSLVAGLSDGTLTRKYCGPNGAVAQSGACEQYITHRDFP